MGYIGAGISRFNTADELTVTGDAEFNGNANFGDSDKAVFGAGSDLQIYHDGSNSYVKDAGTGDLLVQGTQIKLQDASGNDYLRGFTGGAVYLHHAGNNKLETTSSGVSVTGGVVASGGLSIDSYGDPSNNYITLRPSFAPSASGGVGFAAKDHDGANNDGLGIYGHDGISFTSGGSERARLDSSGNLLLGKTALSGSTDGLQVKPAGELGVVRDGNHSLILNRKSSDGNIALFQKDGSTVGVIGTQNWGIGTSSPTSSSGGKLLAIETTADEHTNLVFNTANTGRNGIIEGRRTGRSGSERFAQINIQNNSDNGELRFYTAASGSDVSERGRIDTNGFHFGGTDNNPQASSSSSGGELYYSTQYAFVGMYRPSNPCLLLNRTGSDGELVQFRKSGSTVGNVSVTTTGTTYNTTSDIRLKQDIEPLEATDKLMAMNPVSYSWKSDPDGPRSMGFIAQEMQEVMPEAVSTGDDDDAMMSMDYGRITPILVSALQDAHRKIEQLAAEIAELKAN